MSVNKSAWQEREDGNSIEAIALWQKDIYKFLANDNWEGVLNTYVDISVAWKNLAKQSQNSIFYDIALETLKYCENLTLKHNLTVRHDLNRYMADTYLAAEIFDQAQEYYKRYLQSEKNLNDREKANINSHLGYIKSKTVNKEEGISMMKKAIKDLCNSTDIIYQDKNIALIWQTGGMLRLAEILEEKSKKEEILNQALKIAKDNNLGARYKEIKRSLDQLKSNI